MGPPRIGSIRHDHVVNQMSGEPGPGQAVALPKAPKPLGAMADRAWVIGRRRGRSTGAFPRRSGECGEELGAPRRGVLRGPPRDTRRLSR